MSIITDGRIVLTVWSAALLLAGCAGVQPDARFGEVRELIGTRLNQSVVWQRTPEQETSVRAAVRRLLQHELTAQAAVQIALLNNRGLQASYAELGLAQADLVEAGLLENPVFGFTWYEGDAGHSPELSLVQDFVGILSAAARKRAGQAAVDQITFDVANRVTDLAFEVQAQYFNVVGDSQALSLARQVVTATEAAAELAERQRAAGNLSLREQALQQAFYAQALLEVAQAQAQLATDREALNRMMGLWGVDTNWRVSDRLPAAPAHLPTLHDIESQAVAQRPDLIAARKAADAAAQAAGLTRQFGALGPLGLGIAFKREADGEKFLGPTVELGLPIFNRGQARISRATIEAERSLNRVASLAIDARSEARAARTRVRTAHEVVVHYRDVLLPLQRTIVGETQKQYNGMLTGVYDLLLAKQAQVQAARQYVVAIRDFWLAWTDMERAVGSRLPISAAVDTDVPLATPDTEPDPSQHEHGDH